MAQMATDAQRIMGQVTAMAMLDEAFRARLEASPIEVLQEFGMDVPGTVRVDIISDAAMLQTGDESETVQLYIPDASELSEEELSMVAGAVASCESTAGTCCTLPCISSFSSASTNSCK